MRFIKRIGYIVVYTIGIVKIVEAAKETIYNQDTNSTAIEYLGNSYKTLPDYMKIYTEEEIDTYLGVVKAKSVAENISVDKEVSTHSLVKEESLDISSPSHEEPSNHSTVHEQDSIEEDTLLNKPSVDGKCVSCIKNYLLECSGSILAKEETYTELRESIHRSNRSKRYADNISNYLSLLIIPLKFYGTGKSTECPLYSSDVVEDKEVMKNTLKVFGMLNILLCDESINQRIEDLYYMSVLAHSLISFGQSAVNALCSRLLQDEMQVLGSTLKNAYTHYEKGLNMAGLSVCYLEDIGLNKNLYEDVKISQQVQKEYYKKYLKSIDMNTVYKLHLLLKKIRDRNIIDTTDSESIYKSLFDLIEGIESMHKLYFSFYTSLTNLHILSQIYSALKEIERKIAKHADISLYDEEVVRFPVHIVHKSKSTDYRPIMCIHTYKIKQSNIME